MDYKEKTLKLWKYLAETGVNKQEAYNELGFENDYNDCPLCEYVCDQEGGYTESNGLDCSLCPMYKKWDTEYWIKLNTCINAETYYFRWRFADLDTEHYTDTKKKYAKLLYENFKKDLK